VNAPVKKTWRGKKVLYAGLILVVILVVAGYILLGYSPVPKTSTYPLDIDQIRRLAEADRARLPLRLNVLIEGEGAMPQFLMIAGGGLQPARMPVPVFQIVYPEQTIIVDTGMDQASFEQMFGGGSFSTQAYEQLQPAMRHSQSILLTHEHLDHLAGLTHSPYLEELLPKVILTREQFSAMTPDTGLTPSRMARISRLEYDLYQRIAPGMVLIKAAGHSPGSQMVYLRLQNGAEYLLVGDVVWSRDNLTRLRGRPWLMSLILREDRSASQNQIRALYNLSQSEPIHLLISHDYGQIESYFQQGLIGREFEQ